MNSRLALPINDLKALLDERYQRFANPDFIARDPVSVAHRYTLATDIEIAAFFAATLAWGNRTSILNSANKLLNLMGQSPTGFIMEHKPEQRSVFNRFAHRTFGQADASFFAERLQVLYHRGGLREAFLLAPEVPVFERLAAFRLRFLGDELTRTAKHVSDVARGSAAKRLNLFLRWMVRPNTEGVDFGLWNHIPTASLHIPLDVHTATGARTLGLLLRSQNDWRAVTELTEALRQLDANDPVKYDYALFGFNEQLKKPVSR